MKNFNSRTPCLVLILLLSSVVPLTAIAQQAHDTASHATSMNTMDMSAMPDMSPQTSREHHKHTSGMQQGNMPDMMMGAEKSLTPSTPRSPDYSEGIGYGTMPGMTMHGSDALGKLMFDRLEAFHSEAGDGQQWDMQAWYGKDFNKLWLRSEGERHSGKLEEASVEALWNHTLLPFWGTQLGVRHDVGVGPSRSWAAFGIQGLSPYWFNIEATGYAGTSGRLAARLTVSYELLFTQRLILQPRLEANLYSKDDPTRTIGAGLSSTEFGVQLRYELRRRFAPYVGVSRSWLFDDTRDIARASGESTASTQWVAGVRLWY